MSIKFECKKCDNSDICSELGYDISGEKECNIYIESPLSKLNRAIELLQESKVECSSMALYSRIETFIEGCNGKN